MVKTGLSISKKLLSIGGICFLVTLAVVAITGLVLCMWSPFTNAEDIYMGINSTRKNARLATAS